MDPGRFLFCKSTPPDSSFERLGLGLCLYFKFIKHIFVVFLVISGMAVFGCGICYGVGSANGFKVGSSLQSIFFSGTMGVFSSEHIKCEYAKVSN